MDNFAKPTSPPLYSLPPPAVPVAKSCPFITYQYKVFKRSFCFFKELLNINMKGTVWRVKLHDKVYEVPKNKSNEEMSMILASLGIKKKEFYMLKVYIKDTKVNTKYFTELNELVKFIYNNEAIVDGVSFGS